MRKEKGGGVQSRIGMDIGARRWFKSGPREEEYVEAGLVTSGGFQDNLGQKCGEAKRFILKGGSTRSRERSPMMSGVAGPYSHRTTRGLWPHALLAPALTTAAEEAQEGEQSASSSRHELDGRLSCYGHLVTSRSHRDACLSMLSLAVEGVQEHLEHGEHIPAQGRQRDVGQLAQSLLLLSSLSCSLVDVTRRQGRTAAGAGLVGLAVGSFCCAAAATKYLLPDACA
eukprot:754477-Hanusia_phi.AAC.1